LSRVFSVTYAKLTYFTGKVSTEDSRDLQRFLQRTALLHRHGVETPVCLPFPYFGGEKGACAGRLGIFRPGFQPRANSVQHSDTIEGPENDLRLADDARTIQRPPVAAIVAVVPVVAHDEELARPQLERLVDGEFGVFGRRVHRLFDIGFVQPLAVAIDRPILDLDSIAGQPDQPLDENILHRRPAETLGLHVRRFGRAEHDDIAMLRLAIAIDQLVDENMVMNGIRVGLS